VLLKLKHPEAKYVDQSTIVSSDSLPCDPHPVIYEQITCPLVRSVALKTEGAAGPSDIDAKDGDGDASAPLQFKMNMLFQY